MHGRNCPPGSGACGFRHSSRTSQTVSRRGSNQTRFHGQRKPRVPFHSSPPGRIEEKRSLSLKPALEPVVTRAARRSDLSAAPARVEVYVSAITIDRTEFPLVRIAFTAAATDDEF